jgi:hypothetical protein
VNRFHARLAAQGFNQPPNVDCSHNFSPVVKLMTIRTVLAVTATPDMHAHSADIETVFS